MEQDATPTKLLTVSIAAYNVAPYLRQALDSLVVPEVMDKLEVIVVNDGSKDETSEIAHEYESRHPGTFRVIDKENGGYGSTVNISMKEARGRYFKLLDGDDWFDKEGLRKLIETLGKTDADVVASKVVRSYQGKAVEVGQALGEAGKDLPMDAIPKNAIYAHWHLAFKTSVLRASVLKLPERMLYTDQFFVVVPFAYCDSIRFLDSPVYCYRLGRDGQSVSKESLIRHLSEWEEVTLGQVRQYESDGIMKQCAASEYILRRIASFVMGGVKWHMLGKLSRENCRKAREYYRSIKAMSKDVYKATCDKSTMTGKMLWLMRVTNFYAYWLLALVPGGMPSSS